MKLLLLTLLVVAVTTAEEFQYLNDFATGHNQFTANVYKELQKSNSGNFLVCPLSAETVLALVHAGAGGNTAKELAAGLHLPENKETIQGIFKELSPLLKSSEHYTLSSANKVYVKDGYKIKDQFKNVAVNVFDADIQNIDFEKKTEAASEMNKWVEEKTHNKITNLIKPESLSEDTRSILINAMYFHGKWVSPFKKHITHKRDFYLNSNKKVQTDMMEQTHKFKYYDSPELKAKFLELPYAGEDITMTFVLPNDKEGLSALEENINDVFVAPKDYSPEVHAVIPKFKIKSTIDFIPILENLGIKEPFESNADFNGVLVDEPFAISKVIQKTFIEVEEEGTTAAASTYVEGVHTYSLVIKPIPQEFIADHPFIFYIKIRDVVFFAGRYSSPN